MHRRAIQRVDLQVAILVGCFVVLSCASVFYFSYTLSYKQMLASLADRVHSIALYVDSEVNASVFSDIQDEIHINSEEYKEVHAFLSKVREISTAQYLYTAKRNAQGKLVYHIDGLPLDDPDFRKPGDPIEQDFQKDLEKALTNVVVMPRVIKNTEWGDVFVAYYPLHGPDNKEVIGAIGIEFPASREYEAFMYIRNMTPLIILIACVIAFFISQNLFRRISNPHFKDISNTDTLTGLKNRNAYELDIENFLQSKFMQSYGLVLADLNCLKVVNDNYGHKAGDEYIKTFADVLNSHKGDNHINYRIGGDEFAIFFFNPDDDVVKKFIEDIKSDLKKRTEATMKSCSVAVGYAFCDKLDLDGWETTQLKADEQLYKDKREFYKTHQEFNNRKY